ncbi:MAG TPA: hypothetical protein ENJ18_09000, partial [Nannocystis exedens]|nr:hypothetical protein [Nannocystis exedens]
MFGLLFFIGGACDPLDEEVNSVAAAKTSVAGHDDPSAKSKAKVKAKAGSAAPTTPPPGLAGGAPAAFKAPPGVDHE